jgi:thiamine kinase-like enzyme
MDPVITSYSIQKHIIQASAEGFVIETNSDKSKHLFVKYVQADKYRHKNWTDLQRTLSYTRNEIRFYNEILPLLRLALDNSWDIGPHVHISEYNLDGLFEIESKESTVTQSTTYHEPIYDETEYSILQAKYGAIVMENLHLSRPQKVFQQNPLEPSMISMCLKGLAKFHASAYQNTSLLLKISDRLHTHGGSFHLQNRNPKELTHLEDTWSTFCENMKPHAPPGFFDSASIASLGTRLYKMADYISEQLSPSPTSPFATIVHGDAKAMNIFLFQDEDNHQKYLPLLIDFASSGVGIGMSDVAMHITHALDPKHYTLEDELVTSYITCFREELPEEIRYSYSDEIAKIQYRYATVDYFRFILGRQWKGATMDVFKDREHDLNFAMVNRNLNAALLFIEKANSYLLEIEREAQDTLLFLK